MMQAEDKIVEETLANIVRLGDRGALASAFEGTTKLLAIVLDELRALRAEVDALHAINGAKS